MALHTQQSLADYAQQLETDRNEVEALYHDLLINVTSFFRDPELFEALKTQRVSRRSSAGRPRPTPLRIWVPGCSTGQEAYSLAIALLEFLDDRPVRPPIQIFATDLSDHASLDKARAGVYPEASRPRSARSACGGSSRRKTTSTGSTSRSATCACSRGRT